MWWWDFVCKMKIKQGIMNAGHVSASKIQAYDLKMIENLLAFTLHSAPICKYYIATLIHQDIVSIKMMRLCRTQFLKTRWPNRWVYQLKFYFALFERSYRCAKLYTGTSGCAIVSMSVSFLLLLASEMRQFNRYKKKNQQTNKILINYIHATQLKEREKKLHVMKEFGLQCANFIYLLLF